MVKRICFENGIEPLITLTTLSQQCFESTVPILFDREDKDALHRARKCYDALFEGGKKLGVLPNRLSIEHMHYFEELAPNATNLIRRLHNAIDPERIISPGRYGA
jgi:4-cresol dehydrogenase (hydroxylating)